MGKAKKAHRKKVNNRNKRNTDKNTHIQRLRTKMIQEMIREREAADKIAKENEEQDTKETETNKESTEPDTDNNK